VTYEIFTQRGSPNEIFLAFVTISFCSRADAYLRETGEFGQRASGSLYPFGREMTKATRAEKEMQALPVVDALGL